MTVVNTGLTQASIRAEFFQRFDATTTYFADLATRLASTTGKEEYGFLGQVPPMREWGTGRKARGLLAEKYSIENQKYELTIEVDRDEIDDDQTGQIRLRIQEMATRSATHKDAEIARLLINGAGAGFNSYDGVPFFNASHQSGGSGVQSNIVSRTGTVDVNNPTTAEFRDALKQAIARLIAFKDDQAEPMSNTASGLVCVVPPTMHLTALEAVNATLVNSTTNVLEGAARIIAMPRLVDPKVWYLLKTDVPVRPFIFQDRAPIEFTAQEQDSESGFRREVYEYGVRARYRLTYGYWQFCARIEFAA